MNSIKLPNINELVENALEKAFSLMQNDNLQDAEVLLQQLLRVDKKNIRGMQLLGLIKHKQRAYGEAIVLFAKALQIDSNNAENHNNISLAYACMGFIDKAIFHIRKAIELNPNNNHYHSNYGLHCRQKGDIQKAIECFEKSIAIKSDFYAWGNLGAIYGVLKDLTKAEMCFKEAIVLNPEYHASYVDLAHVYFLQGKYYDAWPLYEHRLECFPPALMFKNVYPESKQWHGKQSLQGKKIVLYCEQGIGDFIHFFRFVNLLQHHFKPAAIGIHTPVGLQSLIKQNTTAEIKEIFTPEEYDYHCSMVSLPYFLGVDSSPIPYIHCEKKANLNNYPEFKIGITWAGNPQHPSDRTRSCKLEYFKKIMGENVKLFSLQKETSPRKYAKENKIIDLTENCEGMGIVDLSEHINNFEDTASFINAMDLIISVDTAVLHLAGALGKKTWAILPYNPDWRWGIEGDTTHWYPTIKLYRQNTLSNWDNVFSQMSSNLC